MAAVADWGTADQPTYKAWLFRTRPIALPAVALVVWFLYAMRFLPSLRPGIWGHARWVLLVVLAIQGLQEIWKLGGDTPLPSPLLGFFLFSIATFASVAYSILPLFSFYKALAFLLGLIGLTLGVGLRHRGRPGSWLRLLASLNLVIVGLSIVSLATFGSFSTGFFQGPFYNPNSLGSALALTFPALLWLREQHLSDAPLILRSKVLTVAVFLNIALVFFSRSRASLLAMALVLVLYAILRKSRFAWIIVYGMFVLLLAAPSSASQIGREAAFKGRDAQLAFTTRTEEFGETLQAAQSNPIGGFGFGTSAGDTEWDGSISAADVGREKTNAYLGVVEEVGLVGGVPLFLGFVATLVLGFRAARRERLADDGSPAALVILVTAGALHVNFEAWLTSAGTYETFIFWATVGVLLMNVGGLMRAPQDSVG